MRCAQAASLYGISPVSDDVAVAGGPYRPVVKAIRSRLIQVGEPGVPRRVGIIPLGLADGYRPMNPACAPRALLDGRRTPIKGVSLEYTLLDLSDFDDARVGDEVVLLGESGDEEILLSDIARWQGSAPHAVLMAFEGRLPARYLDG